MRYFFVASLLMIVGLAVMNVGLPAFAQSGSCAAQTDQGLCLAGNRFLVEAEWRTATGQGEGTPQPLTNDTGYFWFFDSSNVEIVVKVLDACTINPPTFWVFAAGLTNVEVTLRVTDVQSGRVRTYINPLDKKFEPVQDTTPFFDCP